MFQIVKTYLSCVLKYGYHDIPLPLYYLGCGSLKTISLPSSMTSIDSSVFEGTYLDFDACCSKKYTKIENLFSCGTKTLCGRYTLVF